MLEIAVALHQPETARIGIEKTRHDLLGRIAQRPPDPFTCARLHQQAIRIMPLGPEIAADPLVVLARDEHRGQRRDADTGQRFARKKRHRHLDHGFGRRIDDELIGSRRRRTVEQGKEGDAIRVVGLFDPEFAEMRQFFRLGVRPDDQLGVDLDQVGLHWARPGWPHGSERNRIARRTRPAPGWPPMRQNLYICVAT